jgi:hypothetical protein
MAHYLDFVQLQYLLLIFPFGFGPFKSLPQDFGLFENGSKFQNFRLGNGKIIKGQYHLYLLILVGKGGAYPSGAPISHVSYHTIFKSKAGGTITC